MLPFVQSAEFKISRRETPDSRAAVEDAERVECALNVEVSIPAADIIFCIQRETVAVDTFLWGLIHDTISLDEERKVAVLLTYSLIVAITQRFLFSG